jgi:hypothetical protein
MRASRSRYCPDALSRLAEAVVTRRRRRSCRAGHTAQHGTAGRRPRRVPSASQMVWGATRVPGGGAFRLAGLARPFQRQPSAPTSSSARCAFLASTTALAVRHSGDAFWARTLRYSPSAYCARRYDSRQRSPGKCRASPATAQPWGGMGAASTASRIMLSTLPVLSVLRTGGVQGGGRGPGRGGPGGGRPRCISSGGGMHPWRQGFPGGQLAAARASVTRRARHIFRARAAHLL